MQSQDNTPSVVLTQLVQPQLTSAFQLHHMTLRTTTTVAEKTLDKLDQLVEILRPKATKAKKTLPAPAPMLPPKNDPNHPMQVTAYHPKYFDCNETKVSKFQFQSLKICRAN